MLRQAIAHRGRRLEYFTIVWNALEGLIAVAAGVLAGSISLVGFGMDSFIEVTSGATLLWRMSVDADVESRERNEKLSLRIVASASSRSRPISPTKHWRTCLGKQHLHTAFPASHWLACPSSSCRFCHALKGGWEVYSAAQP